MLCSMSVRPITRRDKNFSVKTDKEIRRPAASRPPAVKGARRRNRGALAGHERAETRAEILYAEGARACST